MNRRLLRAAVAVVALAAGAAQSSAIYRWTDPQGQPHYADRVDDGVAADGLQRIELPGEAAAVARLRLEPGDAGPLAWVDNLLPGPIEVMLLAQDGAVSASDPPLPARATVAAHSAALLARIHEGDARLRVLAVPGSPNARPRDVEYALPLPSAPLRVQQAWGGRYSHADAENRYAVDFAAAEGTPVVAARDGVVLQAEAGFADASPGEDEALRLARANFIRILHDDGSMALYAHLRPGGVLVRVGQRVRRGQQIGLSGNTGLSTAPHLHFVVHANRGMHLASIPFRMFGPQGVLVFSEPTGD